MRKRLLALQLPTGINGNLATNTLAGFCAQMLRAFGHKLYPSLFLPKRVFQKMENPTR
jgi:hypothetical protein